MTTFLILTFGLAGVVIGWVVLDYLRQILDALNTLVLRESERRGWIQKEHEM